MSPGQPAGQPAGLLEKLLAAVRPEFRADELAFGLDDPVFGGAAHWSSCSPSKTVAVSRTVT